MTEIVVFLHGGQGLTFSDCEVLVDDVNLLIFRYRSKRNGEERLAKFYTKSIAGWARSPVDK